MLPLGFMEFPVASVIDWCLHEGSQNLRLFHLQSSNLIRKISYKNDLISTSDACTLYMKVAKKLLLVIKLPPYLSRGLCFSAVID